MAQRFRYIALSKENRKEECPQKFPSRRGVAPLFTFRTTAAGGRLKSARGAQDVKSQKKKRKKRKESKGDSPRHDRWPRKRGAPPLVPPVDFSAKRCRLGRRPGTRPNPYIAPPTSTTQEPDWGAHTGYIPATRGKAGSYSSSEIEAVASKDAVEYAAIRTLLKKGL